MDRYPFVSRLSAPISDAASRRIDVARVTLVAEVFYGHLVAIAMPDFGNLDTARWPDRVVAGLHLAVRFGPQAAYLFVFLSGYFIVPRLVAIARGTEAASPVPFLKHRFRRIYPTLIAAILLTATCDWIAYHLFAGTSVYQAAGKSYQIEPLGALSALGNLLSLQPTFVKAFGSNGPLWTLGYLVQFYVVGIVLACGWARLPALTGIIAAFLIAVAVAVRPEWLLLALTWTLAGLVRAIRAPRRGKVLLGTAVLLFIAANRLSPLPSIAAVAIAGALFAVGVALPSASRKPNWRIVTWLSGLSYAIYAVHFPIAMLVYCILVRAVGTGPAVWLPFFVATSSLVIGTAWVIETSLTRIMAKRAR